MDTSTKRVRVALALGAIYLIWGTTFMAVAIMLRTIPPFAGSAMRYTFGGVLLLIYLLLFRPQAFHGLPLRRLILAGALLVAGGNGFSVWAQQRIPSGIAALLISSVPIFVMMLNWISFARRAPDTRALVGMFVGMCGVAVVVVHLHTYSGAVRAPYGRCWARWCAGAAGPWFHAARCRPRRSVPAPACRCWWVRGCCR